MTSAPDSLLDRLAGGMRPDPAGGPLYLQLARMLEALIAEGTLRVGQRLPGHRELAGAVRLNVTTVTKAMGELQRRGLVAGRPGRGSHVARAPTAGAGRGADFQSTPVQEDTLIDLTLNRPATPSYPRALAQLLARLPDDPRFGRLSDYQPAEGPAWAQQSAAQWAAQVTGPVDPARVVLTHGTQHGLACVLAALTSPGDVMLADPLVYQGLRALAQTRSLVLDAVPGDAEGMLPEALERACIRRRPRVLFLVPTFHNPTTSTLSAGRREALLAVARRHDLWVVEDGVYDPLATGAPPALVTDAPERTFYLSGFSKFAAPGLRWGFVIAPPAQAQRVAAALRVDCWSISPLTALVAARCIEDGIAMRLLARQRAELRARHDHVAGLLQQLGARSEPTCPHAWIALPPRWRGAEFVLALRRHGVLALAAENFAIDEGVPSPGVRINLAAAATRDALLTALERLQATAAGDPRGLLEAP